ncbi:MAG: hypothetical protein P8166_10970 [Candidatus Thiodiazotropha sp.]
MTIISFKYNFIFIKTRKVGGTSLEVELSKRIEQRAIVTPISPAVEGHTPRNYESHSGSMGNFYNHMTAIEIQDRLGKAAFDNMYKFTIEREPVSKCISHFHMLRNSSIHNNNGCYKLSWDEYCEAGDFPIDVEKYSDIRDGRRRLICDEVIPYETMNVRLGEIMKKRGIAGFKIRVREKSQYSKNRIVDIDNVTSVQKVAIYDAFSESIAVSGLDGYYS